MTRQMIFEPLPAFVLYGYCVRWSSSADRRLGSRVKGGQPTERNAQILLPVGWKITGKERREEAVTAEVVNSVLYGEAAGAVWVRRKSQWLAGSIHGPALVLDGKC